MYRTTRELVEALDRIGELTRVRAPVSPILEIAAITDRVSKSRAPSPPTSAARRSDPRFHDRGGTALLFENVHDSEMPVVINTLGSYRRMEIALGCHAETPGIESPRWKGRATGFDAIGERIAELVKPAPPRSVREGIESLRRFAPLATIGPKRRRGMGACQEIVWKDDHVDVRRLPIIRCWPLDGDLASLGYPPDVNANIPGVHHADESICGRYITLGGIHTIHARDAGDPRPASHNIGMYRVQVLGPRTMAMHWHMHHDGAAHWRSWKAHGEPMPVAIALGGESVLPYAATCPLPPGISELLMAGFLNGAGIEMCRGLTVPLWVPANAEIIIEGFVSEQAGSIGWDPRDPRCGPLGPGAVFEGPFGDHTGFYSLPDRYPILTITAITHRRDPIYPTTIVGLPPQEDYYLGKATERIMRPLLKTILPDIADYDLPMFGAFHNAASLAIDKHYPLHARRVMHGVWGAGQMAWTKTIFTVGADVDVHDAHAVLRAAAAHCRPAHDIERVRGPLDILDHAAPHLGAGTKIGFDCTPRIAGEEAGGPPITDKDPWVAPDDARADALLAAIKGIATVRAAALPGSLGRGWLLVSIHKREGGDGHRAIGEILRAGGDLLPPFVIVVGADVNIDDEDLTLFHWCAHTSADRDAVVAHTPSGRGVIAFDATPKVSEDARNGEPVRSWPPILTMTEDVDARVRARWNELGLDPAME